MVIIDARSLLSSSRDRDSVLAHVHLAEFKLLRKVIQSGGAELVPGYGVAGVGRLTPQREDMPHSPAST